VDLKINNYYDFLYSFHVTKENYRKAAHVMYECGMRLGNELCTLEGLKRQAKAYLACINCLKLVDAKNAWIVRPVLKAKKASQGPMAIGVSPKRDHEGEEIEQQVTERKMEVLELCDIDRDFQIVCARLKLANKQTATPALSGLQAGAAALVGGGQSTPDETVSLLVAANLYEDAVKIATAFRPPLDCRPIVEGLAAKCVLLTRSSASVAAGSSSSKSSSDEISCALDWLSDNVNPAASSGSDLRPSNAVEAAWKLLEDLVTRLEPAKSSGESQLHRAVAAKLITLGAFLPAWLVNGYKVVNPSELMRLYLANGLLEDAALITIEFVKAVLGSGKEYFGLDNSLQANAAPVWLPHNTIDHILVELKYHSDEQIYKQLYVQLDSVLKKYISTVTRVSRDMIEGSTVVGY